VVLALDLLLEIDTLALKPSLERGDLLIGLHVLDGQGDLIGGLLKEGRISLGILARVDARHREGADAPAADHQRDDDVGAHAVGICALRSRILAFGFEIASEKELLLAENPPLVAIRRRQLKASLKVVRRQRGLQHGKPQDITAGIMKENGGPVKGEYPPERLGDGVEEGVLSQIGDEGVVDLEEGAVALHLVGGAPGRRPGSLDWIEAPCEAFYPAAAAPDF
jgi:hypothetical protein